MKENLIAKIKRTFGVGPLILFSFVIIEFFTYMSLRYFSIPLNLPLAVKITLTIPAGFIFLAGYIWFWTVYLKHNVGTKVLTVGPYRMVRHPLYATDAFTLPLIFALWMNNGVFLIAWILIIISVYFLVKIEENTMKNKFGKEYDDYKKIVPSIIPFKGIIKF